MKKSMYYVCGLPGTGRSTLIEGLLEQRTNTFSQAIHVDVSTYVVDEFRELANKKKSIAVHKEMLRHCETHIRNNVDILLVETVNSNFSKAFRKLAKKFEYKFHYIKVGADKQNDPNYVRTLWDRCGQLQPFEEFKAFVRSMKGSL